MTEEETRRETVIGGSCHGFLVDSDWVILSPDKDQEVKLLVKDIEQASHESHPILRVLYGELFPPEKDGTAVKMIGSLVRVEDDEGTKYSAIINFTVVESTPSPPPDRYGSLHDLLSITSEYLGETEITHTAHFMYELDDSLRSRIQLPFPLLMGTATGEDFGLTHIESVELSRREEGTPGVFQTVQVELIDKGKTVAHGVTIKSSYVLSLEGLRKQLVLAETISDTLLERKEGGV